MHAEAVRDIEFPGAMRGQTHRDGVATVVGIAQRDHIVVARVNARHKQRQIVRFRTGIDEITNFQITWHLGRKFARVFGNVRVQINRRRMLQRFVLFLRNIDDVGVTMTDAHGHDSPESIEISAAMLVPDVLHFPFHQHDRLFVIEKNSRIEKFPAQAQHFISRWAAVFFRLMIEWRELECFHCFVMLS